METRMETKTCNACGRTFTPRSKTQNYCVHPECQRERRRRWQQKKRREDADYRDNDARSSKAWASENPDYWRQYRNRNSSYTEHNRTLQQQRNRKHKASVIANEDVSYLINPPPAGRYRMVKISNDGTPGDVWIVEIAVLAAIPAAEDV